MFNKKALAIANDRVKYWRDCWEKLSLFVAKVERERCKLHKELEKLKADIADYNPKLIKTPKWYVAPEGCDEPYRSYRSLVDRKEANLCSGDSIEYWGPTVWPVAWYQVDEQTWVQLEKDEVEKI